MTAADILGALFRVNLAAAAAILGVVVLRKLVRPHFGARLAYGLWLLPVLSGAAVLIPARQVEIARSAVLAATSGVQPAPLPAMTTAYAPTMLLGLWVVGALGAALIMGYLQLRFLGRARKGAMGPALVGVIAPRIVTPSDFSERYSAGEQVLVLAHERAHLARQDSRLNGLTAAAQCLCWFNPLVHLAAHLMRIDQELACDEAVVARFPTSRRAYAEVLMKAQLATLPLPLGCYWPSKSEHPLIERIAMLRRKGVGRLHRLAGVAALAVLCTGAGVAAWASQPPVVRISYDLTEQVRLAASPEAPAALARPGRAPRVAARTPIVSASTPKASDERIADETPADVAAQAARDAAPASATVPQAPALAAVSVAPAPPPATVFRLPAMPTATPAAETAEGNCYPVFGQLRCDQLSASPASAISKPQPAGSPIIVAALSIPATRVSPVTPQAGAGLPAKATKAAYQIAALDDPSRIVCETRPITGSRFERRICMTKEQWAWQRSQMLSFERFWGLDPSGSIATY